MNAVISNAEAAAVWWVVPIVGAFIWRKSIRELRDLFRRNVAAKEALARRSHTLTDEDWSA